MVVGICGKCGKPIPDSFHVFKEICSCKTKEEWIERSRKNKRMLIIDGKMYDFTGNNY